MKSFFLTAWLALSYLIGLLGQVVGKVDYIVDWSQIGWVFAGATINVLYESLQEATSRRTGAQQVKLVAIGVFTGLLLCRIQQAGKDINPLLDFIFSCPAEVVAGVGGAFGYKLFDEIQKRKLLRILRDYKKPADPDKPEPTQP